MRILLKVSRAELSLNVCPINPVATFASLPLAKKWMSFRVCLLSCVPWSLCVSPKAHTESTTMKA